MRPEHDRVLRLNTDCGCDGLIEGALAGVAAGGEEHQGSYDSLDEMSSDLELWSQGQHYSGTEQS